MTPRQRSVAVGAVLCVSAMAASSAGLAGPPSWWQFVCIVLVGATTMANVLLIHSGHPSCSGKGSDHCKHFKKEPEMYKVYYSLKLQTLGPVVP